jgi:hypothetical protein
MDKQQWAWQMEVVTTGVIKRYIEVAWSWMESAMPWSVIQKKILCDYLF